MRSSRNYHESESDSVRVKHAPNPKRPEAIAMRRIVVEMGCWLSPFMKDAPLPVLTDWERTVDLSRLANVNYTPVDPEESKANKEERLRTPVRLGMVVRQDKQMPSLSELRKSQNEMNSKRSKKRQR